jgi:predicted GIY-YIG superfamily endonuclease/proteasome lid subunit RPN8/RPN11
MAFFVYILRCADGSYYSGHTDNIEIRIAEHQAGEGSQWTKTRLPVEHVWSQEFVAREEALISERRIKGWSRAKKEALIAGQWDEVSRLAKSRSLSALRQAQDERGNASVAEIEPHEVRGSQSIAPETLDAILSHAAEAHPKECCGLLLGEEARITHAHPTANVHPDPATHFEIDPAALIAAHKAERAGGPRVVGYYHSHPNGRAEPSPTDRASSVRDGKVWAIVADGGVRFFRDGEDGFEALSYEVEPR